MASLASLGPNSFVKVLKKDRTHNGFTYALGRNTCTQPWNTEECADGGLYACRLKDIFIWASMYPDTDTVALVEVPDDAQYIEYDRKIKASSLVITHFFSLEEAMELAVEHGADFRFNEDEPLMMACKDGHLDVVKFLVKKGADINVDDNVPLRIASQYGHLAIVRFLVENGADIYAGDDDAISCASLRGHLDVVKFFVEHGADIHTHEDYPLRWASNYGYLDIVKFLVGQGADIGANNNQAIHWASRNRHFEVAQFLTTPL